MSKKPQTRVRQSDGVMKPPSGSTTKKRLTHAQLVKLYPSLANEPTPAQRRKKLLQEARARGIKPFKTEKELDQWIEECGELWESDQEIDEFLAWLRRGRKQGHYD